MPGLVEISAHLDLATATQRVRTLLALDRGTPRAAATPAQRMARTAYLGSHWPVLGDEIIPEGFVGRDDTLWSSFLTRGARCAKSVARVIWKDRAAESRWQGTGFLISDRVVVTNHHVLDSPDTAAAAALEFNYEYDENGNERRGRVLQLDPDRLFLSGQRDGELDYAVIAVRQHGSAAPGRSAGFLPLIAQRGKAQNGDPLNLIHHPAGLRKRITVRDSRLLGTDDLTLHYSGDTLGGSSGAPVFNDQWEVVGLHFGGKPRCDSDGQRLTVTGAVWDPSMPVESIAYEYNVGVRVSSLIRELRARAPSLKPDARALLTEAIGEDQ